MLADVSSITFAFEGVDRDVSEASAMKIRDALRAREAFSGPSADLAARIDYALAADVGHVPLNFDEMEALWAVLENFALDAELDDELRDLQEGLTGGRQPGEPQRRETRPGDI